MHFLFLFLLTVVPSVALSQSINVQVSIRVDTTDDTQREIYTLWKNYLNSRPDSSYDNPYWSKVDKQRYPIFDIGGRFIYSVVTGPVRAWKPHLLSIEPYGVGYELRTAYLSLDTTYPEQHLWAVQRVHAIREMGEWRLMNPMRSITEHYQHHVIGNVEFIQAPGRAFNRELASKTVALTDSIIRTFELKLIDHIEFYIGRNRDELYEMIGLSVLLPAGGGFAFDTNKQLFSSEGSPWYPHEMIHVLFRDFSTTNHPIINEGVPTYLAGGSYLTPTYAESFKAAQTTFALDEVSLDHVLDNQWINGNKDIFYGTGAWLVEQVLQKAGVPGLKRVMASGKSSDQLREVLQKTLGVSWTKIETGWQLAMKGRK